MPTRLCLVSLRRSKREPGIQRIPGHGGHAQGRPLQFRRQESKWPDSQLDRQDAVQEDGELHGSGVMDHASACLGGFFSWSAPADLNNAAVHAVQAPFSKTSWGPASHWVGCAALRYLLTSNPEMTAIYVNRCYSKDAAVAKGYFKASAPGSTRHRAVTLNTAPSTIRLLLLKSILTGAHGGVQCDAQRPSSGDTCGAEFGAAQDRGPGSVHAHSC